MFEFYFLELFLIMTVMQAEVDKLYLKYHILKILTHHIKYSKLKVVKISILKSLLNPIHFLGINSCFMLSQIFTI